VTTTVLAADEPVLGEAEERIIRYEATDGLMDPVAILQRRLAAGDVKLRFDPKRGYLPALLEALRVPISSQGLVFSKTSSQGDHTSPQTPRALYFSDDVSIGWVPDGPLIDLTAVDPQRGPIFYTLAQATNQPPSFVRGADCMRCHISPKTLNVPGWVVQSVLTASNGMPVKTVDGFVNGHDSPLEERWAGWYVTGTHKGASHLGNALVADPDHPQRMETSAGGNVTDLGDRFDTSRYLSPHSDIVALLVLEHQIRMQNLITAANYETRFAREERAACSVPAFDSAPAYLETPDAVTAPVSDWPQQRIARAAERLLEYLLYRNEAPLKGPVKGTSDFAAQFERSGPRDSKGRSLRQLDLQTRLARYPCSFLIYAPAFDALPEEMKTYLWRRLQQILTGQDQSATYATLTAQDRQAVLEILIETKPEFAAWVRR